MPTEQGWVIEQPQTLWLWTTKPNYAKFQRVWTIKAGLLQAYQIFNN